jgi:hypothetical protein
MPRQSEITPSLRRRLRQRTPGGHRLFGLGAGLQNDSAMTSTWAVPRSRDVSNKPRFDVMIIRVRVHRDQGRDFSYKPVQKSMADKPSPKRVYGRGAGGVRMLIGYGANKLVSVFCSVATQPPFTRRISCRKREVMNFESGLSVRKSGRPVSSKGTAGGRSGTCQ